MTKYLLIFAALIVAGNLSPVRTDVGKEDAEDRFRLLEKRVEELESRTRHDYPRQRPQDPFRAKRGYEGFVGFTAYLDHAIDHLGIDQTIVYDKTILNAGNAYNPATGHFIAPLEGYYVFSYYVYVNNLKDSGTKQVVAKLSVDGVNEVDGIADTYHQYHEVQGGNFVVLHLRQGQTVSIQNYRWTDESIDSTGGSRMSTFSGYLVSYV